MIEISCEMNNKLTFDENIHISFKELEKKMNTGPIIGEAQEVIKNLLVSNAALSLLVSCLGVDEERKTSMIKMIYGYLAENDRKILEERKKENDNTRTN